MATPPRKPFRPSLPSPVTPFLPPPLTDDAPPFPDELVLPPTILKGVLKAIDTKAEIIRRLNANLNQQIAMFEKYLSSLNGRMETYLSGVHPDCLDDDDLELTLKFHRVEKEWIISSATTRATDDGNNNYEWKPLREASIKLKLKGIDMLPELLVAIQKSQDELIKKMEHSFDNFHAFLEKVIQEEEGK